MSGSNSSVRGSRVLADGSAGVALPVGLTVHSMPLPELDGASVARRTRAGRARMLLVLAVCAAPVVASYFTYFVIRPEARTNYSALIQPMRPLPDDLPLRDLEGHPVAAASLKGRWLLVVVGGGACDPDCEKKLWLQRQLRETLGRDAARVQKVWLVDDAALPRAALLDGIRTHTEMTVLRVPAAALANWLQPAPGRALRDHFYIVDPLGNWMMRSPPAPEPRKLKGDVEKLLRASAGWNGTDR